MIRSNPTAIPLRAGDVKLLQAEIDKRKAAREATTTSASGSSSGAGTNFNAASNINAQGSKHVSASQGGVDKQGRTVAERIGL
ncbi:hypothetical protein IAT40_002031 [Kwoniella sp. CBS 6097]